MNKFVNPPCISSLATSYAKSKMACSQGKMTALFSEVVSCSAEGEMAFDETASTVSLAPNVCVVPGVFAAVQESEEYVKVFAEHLSGEESAERHREEEHDNDSFVVIMSGITAVGDVESEGWSFADALARVNLSVETLAVGVVDTSHLPTCLYSFFIAH